MLEFDHTPVMPEETIGSLNIDPEGIYVDGTVGGAGHASILLSRLGERGRFIGLDQDSDAVEASRKRLEEYGDRAVIVKSNYENMPEVLSQLGIYKVNGIMLDLGVSSHQLDDGERGFSYRFDAPLDMRMDRDGALTAKDIVNTYPEGEIARIIRDYGEERYASSIAKRICRVREKKEIETTFELNDIIKASMPARALAGPGHPSKRTFQALRIACNRELEVLETSIDRMIQLLLPGGRLSIITFHSLEDRIVKNAFKRNEDPCTCPPGFPVCVCGKVSQGRVVTRKPILPGTEEEVHNPRSKSAKLRCFEKA